MMIEYVSVTPPPAIPNNHALWSHCYLCGKEGSKLEKEHVIPKIMFAPQTTDKTLVLRACTSCHSEKSKDDEYVTRQLQATSFSMVAELGFAEGFRGVRKGSGIGIHRDMLDRLVRINVFTPGGLLIGRSPGININVKRINSFLIRIAKGLLVRNMVKIYDWNDYDFRLSFQQALEETDLLRSTPFREIWQQGKFGELWRGVLAYKGHITDDSDCSVWVMTIYNFHLAAVGIAKKSSVLARNQAEIRPKGTQKAA